MKKILVTGATGFIGNYVIDILLKQGYRVIASSAHEDRARLANWFSEVDYIPFDLGNFDPSLNYYHFFEKPDLLIHLAWEGLPHYKKPFHLEINYPRHLALLENLIRNGVEDITVTGTCLEYGMQEGHLSEDIPSRPENPYAMAKDALRQSLQDFQNDHPFNFKWIRLFYMFGKGQNPNSLFSQLDKALAEGNKEFKMSGGEQIRDYLPVEKVAEYIVRIALQRKVTGVINCSSNNPITIRDLVERYLLDKKIKISLNLGFYPYPDYEPMQFWGDNAKLKTVLNNE